MKGGATVSIGKNEIRALIPHSGSMCLLDDVMEWDEQSILCTSSTHQDRTNPLRRGQHLSAIHAFEYAAQAIAVHGGLRARSAGSIAPPGYLAALRDASMQVTHLDLLPAPLAVRARCLFSDNANAVYDCDVRAGDVPLASGRITIILRSTAQPVEKTTSSVARTSSPVLEMECLIPHDHPSLAGHFPGEPIVPGVVILDEVAARLADQHTCRINRIQYTKFLSPLTPAETFHMFLTAPASTVISFQCCAKNRTIAEGQLTCHG
jgi:predicted hotdog family 3-hydroxylacyl-ACP dehydratase